MDTTDIIKQLTAERDRLNAAIALLSDIGSTTNAPKRKRKPMSAAARKRISEAQKARWAKAKKVKA